MNKTKEEIIAHLADENKGYTFVDSLMITAFLYGKGIIDANEDIGFEEGNLVFDDFVEWFENEEVEQKTNYDDVMTLVSIIEDIVDLSAHCHNTEPIDRCITQLEFLADVAEKLGYTIKEEEV